MKKSEFLFYNQIERKITPFLVSPGIKVNQKQHHEKRVLNMALTRAEIADRLILKQNLPKATAQEFVDCFFETIASTLEKGEVEKLTGFGNFELKLKNARPGRNPKTGQEVTITPRRVTTFKAGQKLRNRIDAKE